MPAEPDDRTDPAEPASGSDQPGAQGQGGDPAGSTGRDTAPPRRPLVDTSAGPRSSRATRGGGVGRALRWVLVAVAAAVAALALGVGAAYVVSAVRGQPEPSGSASAGPTPAPTAPASATPAPTPSAAPVTATVPAGWTTARVSALGLTVRHPPGWVRYPQARVTVWVRPSATGSRGVDEVGVGRLAPGPATSVLEGFGSSFFAGQPALVVPAATGNASGADLVLTYTRVGTPVRVALHAQAQGSGVRVTLARTAAQPPAAAATLLAQFRAGVQG